MKVLGHTKDMKRKCTIQDSATRRNAANKLADLALHISIFSRFVTFSLVQGLEPFGYGCESLSDCLIIWGFTRVIQLLGGRHLSKWLDKRRSKAIPKIKYEELHGVDQTCGGVATIPISYSRRIRTVDACEKSQTREPRILRSDDQVRK